MIINTDYIDFLRWLYECHPGLENQPYDEQMRVRYESLFGTADFYSSNLRKLGHEAWDVIANIEPIQKQWAREHGVSYKFPSKWLRSNIGILPWLYHKRKKSWLYTILAEQVKSYRPDVLYCMCIETIGSDFLRSVKGYYRLAIGQHAAPLPPHDIKGYDLLLSSLPSQVDWFGNQGMYSELFRLGFESRILSRLSHNPKRFDLVFVGGFSDYHKNGRMVLEYLCDYYNLSIWGYGIKHTSKDTPLRSAYRGTIWGLEMYQVLQEAKIVFNRHIDIAGSYAANMRLYEGTGVGSMLITDNKKNLSDMFEPNKEVIVYNNAKECADLVGYYLKNENERESIALSGQKRTLNEHTYYHRMEELLKIVQRYM